jgi:FAD/FMN-containing dehydrogenase
VERRPSRRGPSQAARRIHRGPAIEDNLNQVRELGLGATAYPPHKHETHEGWEDAAVPPERLGEYLRDFRTLLARHDYHGASLYGHFGHGCVHTRIPFELRTPEGIANYRSFAEQAADLVVSYAGSLSGEHGDGQSRGELLPKMIPAAVAWPGTSASSAGTTRCRPPARSAACGQRLGRPIRTPPSWPTDFPAAPS